MSSRDTTTPGPSTQGALLVAVLAMSTSAVLARRAGEAPATVIAFWRCALAASVMAPALLFGARRSEYRRELAALAGPERALLVAAGVFLGLHFQTWISSLDYTTIASSSMLVSTTPVWVALGAALLPGQGARDPLPRGAVLALCVCVLGSVTIGWGDFGLSRRALGGDALALAGALFAALYLLAGRQLRSKVGLPPYLTAVYGVAALWLLASCALEANPLAGYRRETALAILAIALIPQLIGHSTFNWALRWTSARLVAVAALGEPIFSTLWGFLLEHEVPGACTWTGGAILLLGIYLAVRAERPREPARSGAARAPPASREPARHHPSVVLPGAAPRRREPGLSRAASPGVAIYELLNPKALRGGIRWHGFVQFPRLHEQVRAARSALDSGAQR